MPEVRSTRERARIQLCGRLSIEVDGIELADRLRGRQVPLLFAYMVLCRERAMSRDELAEALWPDSAPRSQDGALRTLLSRLRSVLGPDAVVGRDEVALELPEPTWIDLEAAAAQLPRAAAALERRDARAAWALAQVPLNIAGRGLLPGVQASWVEPRRRELAELRLQALEVIGRAGMELGGTQLGSVERAGRALIELEPFRESGYVLLMEALAAQGNIAEAVRVFERLRRLLRDDLGTVPSPEAIAVHERLLGTGTGPARTARGHEQPQPADPGGRTELELPGSLRVLAEDTLVGRDSELAAIREWWANARERMLLLAGEPGMGKSRLQAELAAEVHRAGGVVLAGHAPDEVLIPYQPLLEAIGQFAFGAPLADLRAAVQRAGEAGADLARLIPEIRRRLPELPAPGASDPDTDRYRLFEAVADLIGWIGASGPLLIALDDLHWADRPTLLMLRHLLRSPQAAGLRILGAYRTGEPGAAELTATVAPLRREGLVRGLDVGGLDREASVELLRLRAGGTPSAALQRALYEETEGNPLFLSELVRHLQESGVPPLQAGLGDLRRVGLPDDVRALISRRLARLSADGLEWLRGAAVIGREFDASLLETVLGFDEDRFLEALEEALDARLIAEAPGAHERYMFSHALVRETLYAGTSTPRRLRTHHRVGIALEARAAARAGGANGAGAIGAPTDSEIAALAHHFTHAGDARDPERAITYALAAGEQATEMLAHEEAADHYARALEVLDRADSLGSPRERRLAVLLELGEARLRSGDRVEAWPAFREAAALAVGLGDRGALIRAAVEASRRFIQPPGLVEQDLIELLDLALEQTAGERSVTRVRLLARLCMALYFTPRRDETRRLSAEATAIAAHLADPEAAALAAGARRRAWWGPGQLERRLADSTMLLRSARDAGDVELTLQGHLWLVLDLLEAGDRRAVEAQIEAFALEAEPLRQPRLTWNVLTWRAMLALLDGRLSDAERLSADALAAGIRIEGRAASQYHVTQMVAIRSEQGRSAEMAGMMARTLQETEGRVSWRAGAASHYVELGERERARAELQALVGPDAPEIPADGEWLGAMVLLAETASALGDTARAQMLYERLAPYADTVLVFGVGAVCWGSVSLCLGRLALACDRREQALAHLERALRTNTALGARIHVATTQLELARALGASERARDLLATAARTAQELGLARVARVAETLGARLG